MNSHLTGVVSLKESENGGKKGRGGKQTCMLRLDSGYFITAHRKICFSVERQTYITKIATAVDIIWLMIIVALVSLVYTSLYCITIKVLSSLSSLCCFPVYRFSGYFIFKAEYCNMLLCYLIYL